MAIGVKVDLEKTISFNQIMFSNTVISIFSYGRQTENEVRGA